MGKNRILQRFICLIGALLLAILCFSPRMTFGADVEEEDLIILTAKASGKTCKLTWNPVLDANKYVIYLAEYAENANPKTPKKYKTVSGNSYSFRMKKGYDYMMKIVAYEGSDRLCKSLPVITFAGKRDTVGKATKVKLAKTTISVEKGKDADIDCSIKMSGPDSQGDVLDDYRYVSNDEEIAEVDDSGTVYGNSVGTCTVYVLAVNGVKAAVRVNVTEPKKPVDNNYKISFDPNGGTGTMAGIAAAPSASIALPANTFTRSGYTFASWNTKADGSGVKYADKASVKGLASQGQTVTLYAQWTQALTVTFDSNGGSEVPAQNIVSGGKVVKPANPTRSGYVFNGWYLKNLEEYDFNTPVTSSFTLLAKWTKAFTVTFDSNEGSKVDPQSVTKNEKAKKPADPTRAGYSFDGWYTTQMALYDFESPVTKDFTLYAKWTPISYTIKFDANGGTGSVPADITAVYDKNLNLPSNALTRTNLTASGWNTKPDGKGTHYDSSATVKNLTDKKDAVITLYAQWAM